MRLRACNTREDPVARMVVSAIHPPERAGANAASKLSLWVGDEQGVTGGDRDAMALLQLQRGWLTKASWGCLLACHLTRMVVEMKFQIAVSAHCQVQQLRLSRLSVETIALHAAIDADDAGYLHHRNASIYFRSDAQNAVVT